jgi:hypothetical protein
MIGPSLGNAAPAKSKIIELHRDRAIVETERGARQSYRRRPVEVGRIVLAWEVNTVILSPISPAGERMRRHRQRRRDKLPCLLIELRESEIEALIRQGLLLRR